MKKDNLILKLVAGMLLLMVSPPLLCHAAINQILYMAKYNGTPVFGTDTLGGVTYSTITYGDLINGGEPGMPSLPIDYLRFSVPYNATNFTVTTTLSSNWPYYIDHLLYPCQAPRMMNDTTPVVITLPDTAAYYSGTTYPTQAAWVVDEGFLEGENHIVTVAVMPFQYVHSASSDLIAQKRTVTVKLRYDLSDTLAMYPIVRNDSLLREEGYQLTRSMVVNPNQVKSFAPATSQLIWGMDSMGINPNGLGGDGLNGLDPPKPNIPDSSAYEMHEHEYNYPYLIVTSSDLTHSLRRLVALKRQKGYNVQVVTMNDVKIDPIAKDGDRLRQPDGSYHVVNDKNDGILRQFLRYYYNNFGTKYVLLAGTSVPYHITDLITENTSNNHIDTIRNVLSDLYFSDLNSDWSSQNKDRNAELYVGRITAWDDEQMDNYTDKLFRYALNPGKGDHTYLRRAFYCNGRDFTNGLMEMSDILDSIFPINNSTIFNDSRLNFSEFPKGKDVIDTIRTRPVGFMCIFNHGDSARVRVYGTDSHYYCIKGKSPIDKGNGLNCLQNKYYPMIYNSLSCETMPFDIENVWTFGESFILGKDYGGPVYMGYTRSVNNEEIRRLGNAFAERIREGYVSLGEAYYSAKVDKKVYSSYVAPFIQGYLGDPDLEIWTDNPQSYSNISISRCENSVTISGIDAGSTTVAYCSNDLKQGNKIVTSSSITLNNVSPNSSIMLYRHNHIPYIAPLELQNVTLNKSQYVIASDVICGRQINSGRSPGEVIIPDGIEYEIESSGTVILEGGFIVQKGAEFAVYPSCF